MKPANKKPTTLREAAAQAGYRLTVVRGGRSFRLWCNGRFIPCETLQDVKQVIKTTRK